MDQYSDDLEHVNQTIKMAIDEDKGTMKIRYPSGVQTEVLNPVLVHDRKYEGSLERLVLKVATQAFEFGKLNFTNVLKNSIPDNAMEMIPSHARLLREFDRSTWDEHEKLKSKGEKVNWMSKRKYDRELIVKILVICEMGEFIDAEI